jgi:hypothetical protein
MRLSFLKKNTITILAVVFSSACIFGTHHLTKVSAQDSVNVNLNVEGCNNNFICEAVIGEDANSCPNDCGVATTTPPTQGDGSSGGSSGSKLDQKKDFEIFIESIETTASTIRIVWTSSVPTNGTFSWSASSGYNLGSLQEIGYITRHNLVLTNLSAETSYAITLSATDLYGNVQTRIINSITQKSITAIPSVSNVSASDQDGGMILRWQNPSSQFDYVRIVKSDDFFPSGPYDGEVVYEGGAQSFFDPEIVEGTRYYYSIFVKSGSEFSPGVLQNFIRKPQDGFFEDVGEPVTIFGPIYDSTVVTDIDNSLIEGLLHVYQDGVEVTRANNIFYVKNGREILLAVDKSEAIPSWSQVFVSYFTSSRMEDGREYVLEYNEKQGKFVTNFTISNSERSVPFILYIRNNQEIRGYVGYFNSDIFQQADDQAMSPAKWIKNDFFVSIFFLLLLILILLILLIIFIITKRRKHIEK